MRGQKSASQWRDESRVALLFELFAEGLLLRDIADRLGTTERAVNGKLLRSEMRRRPLEHRPASPEERRRQRHESRRRYLERYPDAYRDASQRYRERHPEKAKENVRQYRERNRDLLLIKDREQKATPHGRRLGVLRSSKRRALERNAPGSFTAADLEKLIEIQKKCHICGKRFTEMKPPTIDHVIAIANGGAHDASNIALAHRTCNVKKQKTRTHLL